VSGLPRRRTRALATDSRHAVGTDVVPTLTPSHDAVLAVLDCSTPDTVADAVLVASLLDVPEAEVVQLLDELEEAGCVASATGPVQ
jgi:DNA-binding MarR family transcriptional regulator